MTRQEVGKLVAVCIATWPNHPVDNVAALVSAWELALGDVPYEVGNAALATYLREGTFFPAPAEIRTLAVEAVAGLPDAGDAWRLVLDRMKATYPGIPASPWDAPEPVRKTVDAMGGMEPLRRSENPGADHARFAKTYAVYRQRAAREADLPALWAGRQEATFGDRIARRLLNGADVVEVG